MSYPTLNFKHMGATMGAQPINETSSVQNHPIGQVVDAYDGTYKAGKFIYLAGAASTAAGDLVCYNSKSGATVRTTHGGSGANGPAAVAMSANLASFYGWYQIQGSGPVKSGTVAADAALYLTSTAGSVDDAAVSGDLVDGLTSKAADSGGFTTCQIDFPNISSIGAASGNQATIDLARYITLSAAAEAADAIVVTGQVKDWTGTNISVATQVLVRTLAVTNNKGAITVTAGTSKKVVTPATGENVAWIETTAAGAFAVSVANDVAEVTLIQVTADSALAVTQKLTFA